MSTVSSDEPVSVRRQGGQVRTHRSDKAAPIHAFTFDTQVILYRFGID